MQKTWTVGEIAAASKEAGRFFFSPDSLRFFGQRLRDFKVRHVAGRVFVTAPRKVKGVPNRVTFAEFNPKTGHCSAVTLERTATRPFTIVNDRDSMEEYLAALKG